MALIVRISIYLLFQIEISINLSTEESKLQFSRNLSFLPLSGLDSGSGYLWKLLLTWSLAKFSCLAKNMSEKVKTTKLANSDAKKAFLKYAWISEGKYIIWRVKKMKEQ